MTLSSKWRIRSQRGGQVVIFLLMLLVSLAFVLLWDVDLHRIVTIKTKTQNAGDTAALSGARWQGITLNLVGELNLLHTLALSTHDTAGVDAITNMQARLLFLREDSREIQVLDFSGGIMDGIFSKFIPTQQAPLPVNQTHATRQIINQRVRQVAFALDLLVELTVLDCNRNLGCQQLKRLDLFGGICVGCVTL